MRSSECREAPTSLPPTFGRNMKDYSQRHALILTVVLLVGAPLAVFASYYQHTFELRALGVEQYAWDFTKFDLPAIVFSALLGIGSFICWLMFRSQLKWARKSWIGLLVILLGVSLYSLILYFNLVVIFKLAVLAYLLRHTIRFLKTDRSEPCVPTNPLQH